MGDAADEAAVDLEDVEKEILEVTERREARAEIVEREADPAHLQSVHEVDDQFRHRHRGAFGDLENQARANALIPGQPLIECLDPRSVADGAGGHVDRKAQTGHLGQGAASQFDRQPVDGPPELDVLHEGHEFAGGNDTARGVEHTDEALVKRGGAAGLGMDDGLIGQHRVAALHGFGDHLQYLGV